MQPWFLALVLMMGRGPTSVAEAPAGDGGVVPTPVHAFVQGGVGVTELLHVEAGAFLGAHLTVEAMAALEGVFGVRYGGGAMYAFGHAQVHENTRRPPRNALLVGARVMLNSSASFDTNGDDLSSYVLLPVGYGYLSDSGFYLRATIGPVVVRGRRDQGQPVGGPIMFDRAWTVTGPMLNVGAGLAF